MVELETANGNLLVTLGRADALWAMKRRLEIPLGHIRSVRRAGPEHSSRSRRGPGFRWRGARIPGLTRAGTCYQGDEKIFWGARDADRAIVIELESESYSRLVVEVRDPEFEVDRLREALAPPRG